MSGGHFCYDQRRIETIAHEIELLIANNDDTIPNKWGEMRGRGFSPEVLERLKEAAHDLNRAAQMADLVDWLVCGDYSASTFMRKWDNDVPLSWKEQQE